MKKVSLISLIAFVFLAVTSVVSIVAKPFFTDCIIAIAVALGMLLVSGILAFIAKKRKVINIICFFINCVAFGIALRGWYIYLGMECGIAEMLLICLGVALFFFIFGSITRIPFVRNSKALVIVVFVLHLIFDGFAIYLALLTMSNIYLSTIAYFLIASWGFLFPLALESDDVDSMIRNLTLSTYSVFVAVVIMALIILTFTTGEALDCDCEGDECDCCDGASERRAERRRKREIRKYGYALEDEPYFGE